MILISPGLIGGAVIGIELLGSEDFPKTRGGIAFHLGILRIIILIMDDKHGSNLP